MAYQRSSDENLASSVTLAKRKSILKLLIAARFPPSVGGIETITSLLAHEWARLGEEVSVVTDVGASGSLDFPFPVHRRPAPRKLLRLFAEHDAIVHFNVSLRLLWPILICRRAFVASHHGIYVINRVGERDWRERLKLICARRATANIAASAYIAKEIRLPCHVIGNPFDAKLFVNQQEERKTGALIFVGRLVTDKGVETLLEALVLLKTRSLTPQLTIVGDGPLRQSLEEFSLGSGLHRQVNFVGHQTQVETAALLKGHRILVVPSLYDEPFGVVALEGIASGCAVIGSRGGGLPEAIGPCGLTFPNGDAAALSDQIERLLKNPGEIAELLSHAHEHLAGHDPGSVAGRYLDVIREAVCRR